MKTIKRIFFAQMYAFHMIDSYLAANRGEDMLAAWERSKANQWRQRWRDA